jgi:hypothetical protein
MGKDRDRKGKGGKGGKAFDFAQQHVSEYTLEGMESEAEQLFVAAGRYAQKVRSKIPADNRNNGHLMAPLRIKGIGDICLLMLMHGAGFSADGINGDGVLEIGVFVVSPALAKRLGSPGAAAGAIGMLMAETEEGDG